MRKLAYLFVLSVLLAGAAQAQDAAQLAQRLVERSGLAVQLQSVPKSFQDQMAAMRGQAPDELVLALSEAGREAYKPEAMAQEIAKALAETLKPDEMRPVLAWLETGVGRRVTVAEERSSAMDEASLQRYMEELKAKPPGEQRRKLIEEVLEVTSGLEFGARLLEGMALGVAIGMDSTQPVQKRAGIALLRKQIEKVMPKELVKAQLRVAMPAMLLYTYREVSDADLAAYVEFLRSADGKRANDAITEAFTQAMVAASVRLGQFVDQRSTKQPT
jgi:Uncharacterized protein conserved in bacteria (DUF2059)